MNANENFAIVPVTKENFDEVTALRVAPGQEHYVATNMKSLAQAWLYRREARPMAITVGGVAVGFLMLDWDEEDDEHTLGLWRLMIDERYQGRGYGRRALAWVLDTGRKSGVFRTVNLDYAPENHLARDLYKSMGFVENGQVEDGEIVMVATL